MYNLEFRIRVKFGFIPGDADMRVSSWILVSRLILLTALYALVLGLPTLIVVQYPSARFLPLALMAILATLAPAVYLSLQRIAENRLLRDQRRYQERLLRAAAGMGRIKQIGRLLKLIVRIVIRAVRVEFCAVYIIDTNTRVCTLGTALTRLTPRSFPPELPIESPLTVELARRKRPLLLEEERRRSGAAGSSAVSAGLAALGGELVVPCMIDDRLTAFLILGPKVNGKSFTSADMAMFTVLANQAAAAIENALFYQELTRSREQLCYAEKMATIGTMADGLSHQINNRLHTMGFIAGGMADTLAFCKEHFNTPALKEVEGEIINALSRIQDNVTRGGEIVQGLMKYSCKGDEGFAPCEVDKLIDAACEMLQFRFKAGLMDIVRRYDPALTPRVNGNFSRLQEVFFNLINNAYDATLLRKATGADLRYVPELVIHAESVSGRLHLVFTDNGIGIRDEDQRKLFTPFFTTKASSRKGTGLGLYIIRKIVEEDHGGRVDVKSSLMSGTSMMVSLPLFQVPSQ